MAAVVCTVVLSILADTTASPEIFQQYDAVGAGRGLTYIRVVVPPGQTVVTLGATVEGCTGLVGYVSANRLPLPELGEYDLHINATAAAHRTGEATLLTLHDPLPAGGSLYTALQDPLSPGCIASITADFDSRARNHPDGSDASDATSDTPPPLDIAGYTGRCPQFTLQEGVWFDAVNFAWDAGAGFANGTCRREAGCTATATHPHAEGTLFQIAVANVSAPAGLPLYTTAESTQGMCALQLSTARPIYGTAPFPYASRALGAVGPAGLLARFWIPDAQVGTRWEALLASDVHLNYTLYPPVYRTALLAVGAEPEQATPPPSALSGTVTPGAESVEGMQFPRGGWHYLLLRSAKEGAASASVSARNLDSGGEGSGCPSDCHGQGTCLLLPMLGGAFFEACDCDRPYEGYDCTQFRHGSQYPPRFFALTLSNIAFLPAIWVCFAVTGAYIEGSLYLVNMAASTTYHMCDEDTAHLCLFDYSTMQFLDFFVAFSSLWFTILYLARLKSIKLRGLLQVQGLVFLSVVALQYRLDPVSYCLPLGLAAAIAFYRWWGHCGRAGVALESLAPVSPVLGPLAPLNDGLLPTDSEDGSTQASTYVSQSRSRAYVPSCYRRCWYRLCCPLVARRGVSLWGAPWFHYPTFAVGCLLAGAGLLDIAVLENDGNYAVTHSMWHILIGLAPAFLVMSAQRHRPVDTTAMPNVKLGSTPTFPRLS